MGLGVRARIAALATAFCSFLYRYTGGWWPEPKYARFNAVITQTGILCLAGIGFAYSANNEDPKHVAYWKEQLAREGREWIEPIPDSMKSWWPLYRGSAGTDAAEWATAQNKQPFESNTKMTKRSHVADAPDDASELPDAKHVRTIPVEDSAEAQNASAPAPNSPTGAAACTADDDGGKPAKFPKQRMAVLFGYRGSGYKGSQLNPGQNTIEKELMDAFVAAGCVTEANNDAKKVGLNRCARTDKGVHAAGNVISLKMMAIPEIVSAVNSKLPEQIRVFDIFQVTSSFNAKNHCGGRQYEYTLPTYFLKKSYKALYPHSDLPVSAETTDSENYIEICKHRLEPSDLAHLRDILKCYEGTHNFHNFTVGVKFKEKCAGRYISSFTACDPYIREDGVEWISLHVSGQSFMLHQIRKMVGLAAMMVRTATPSSLVAKTFADVKINVPKVPGIGLLLRQPLFTAYNAQHKQLHATRREIDFKYYTSSVQPFVEKFINADLYASESSDHVFLRWCQNIDLRSGQYSWWLTAGGDILADLKPTNSQQDGVEEDDDEKNEEE
ncbi:tRNA pseudouridine synthase 1 [Entophlyctis luteolus]|nr:tRNA pseudouridine synthase 1 [Entophlyctis luteolus]